MSSKSIKISIIIVLSMLCLLAGAWLLLYESRCDRANIGSEEAISRAALDYITEGSAAASEGSIASVEKVLGDWITADRVYSHRGSAGSNEHSFEAYDAAIEAGSHNIEQDVVVSGDGTLYVSHDLTAKAMTGDGRAYSSMSDSEIDALTTSSGGHILKLEEVFEHYDNSVKYIIELKSGDDATIDAFKQVVDEHDKANRIIVQSFDISVLEKLEEIYPDMPKLYLCKTQSDVSTGINSDVTDSVCVSNGLVSQSNCDAVHDAGKDFSAWTLDSEYEITNAIDIGADSYFTNDTPLAIELEKKLRPFRIKTQSADGHSTIFFASDYQPEEGFDAPKDTLAALLSSAISDGKTPDAVVMCGDYTNEHGLYDYQLSPDDSINEIKEVVREAAPEVKGSNMVFVQGNHDAMGDLISQSGLHEYDNYLIYVLNTEEDFPWSQGKTAGSHDKVSAAATDMKECFDKLIAEGETRPVFIAGHVPLHYSARTSSRHSTGDNLYASLIFDVVNEAAESLDIIYMHGHNHNKGWDCYMGGAAAYKTAGDEIIIPVFHDGDITTDDFDEKTLNFTYLNAGYTGYYMNCAASDYDGESYKAADETLTATVCEVYKDRIEITRYDTEGRHVLGAAGEANPYKGGIDEGLIGPEHYGIETESPVTIERKGSKGEELDDAA